MHGAILGEMVLPGIEWLGLEGFFRDDCDVR